MSRSLGGQPEGSHVDERGQRLVFVVGTWVQAADCCQLAQPEVTLLGAGADKEVATSELRVELGGGAAGRRPPLGCVLVPGQLELLEVKGVVEVHDHDLVGGSEHVMSAHHRPLDDEHVGPRLELLHRLSAALVNLEARGGELAEARRGEQPGLVVDSQGTGDLPCPDRWSGHP